MKTNLWYWERVPDGPLPGQDNWKLRDTKGRNRCDVWSNGTWHTWDERGIGGENDVVADNTLISRFEAERAVIRQGWVKREQIRSVADEGVLADRLGEVAAAARLAFWFNSSDCSPCDGFMLREAVADLRKVLTKAGVPWRPEDFINQGG